MNLQEQIDRIQSMMGLNEQKGSITVRLEGPVQTDYTYNGQEEQISYHIYSELKKLNDATQITNEDKTYADYEMQGYTDTKNVEDTIKKVIPSVTCTVNGMDITCTFTLSKYLNEQVGSEYNFNTDGMKSETHVYKITDIQDSSKKQRDPADPRNITGTIPTKKITLQWTNPPQGLPSETIVITKECGNNTITPPRGYTLDNKFIEYVNGLC
jgi:hypothetical protein